MRLWMCVLSALIICEDGKAKGAFTPPGQPLHINDGNFSNRDHMKQEPFQNQQVLLPLSDSAFNLKVQVNNVMSREYLSQALVEVYINYTLFNTALTGEDGSALLHVPYQTGTAITLVASKDGYICTLLPCKTDRMPNASSKPIVQFPKSLLNLTDSSNATAVRAYLTIPKLPSEEDGFLKTLGIMSTKSGYVSVELSPVAAVSVKLFSGDTELHVRRGDIQISLSIPDSRGLQTSDVVPAWFFNRTTGGWMRKGLGMVVSVEGKLMWTFTAPHLGYWIAAPLSSTRGFFGLAIPIDFILNHSSLLMVILGGMLVIIICLLVGLLFNRRQSLSEPKKKKILPAVKRDQTTSTCDDEFFEEASLDSSRPQNGLNQSLAERGDNKHNGNVMANPNAVAIRVERDGVELNPNLNEMMFLHDPTDQIRVPVTVSENLFFYNQPVAILHGPAFFHLEEQAQWSKSATLPRAGAASDPLSKDEFTQSPPKSSAATQNQEVETEDQSEVLEEASTSSNTSSGHFSLPESASVPGTLNKIRGSRRSVPALGELSKIPSAQAPRAWFVSLEGKPAAEIHYAVSEQQRARRPADSRETSLDSGVDMSELNQLSGRRAVPLERKNTFIKSSSSSKEAPPE
ncbi:protein FAM171B-like isoform X2 [Eleginops maclovinus]|uniref:protein FAM171B-like isoform X2 n=1 Tax=Eleginops maclovinus TaxID=56733 RepID=UPI003080C54C